MAQLVVKEVKRMFSEGSSSRPSNIPKSESLRSGPADIYEGIDVLFSAHGVPRSYIMAGDPYQLQIEECFQLVSNEVIKILQEEQHPIVMLNQLNFHLSYQSRVGPVEWLKPYTEETIKTLAEDGVMNLIVVPVSFVSEHIETLEEIDMEYRELAESSGIGRWRRVPALNTDVTFINDMTDMVLEALESPSLVLSDAVSPIVTSMTISTNQLIGDFNSTGINNFKDTNSNESKQDNSGFYDNRMNWQNGIQQNDFTITKMMETLNGRFAMLGIVGTTLYEIISGHPVVHIMGFR
eukprot:CAMPEP_0196765306 /NCGR_PEP_ID=MMETSP1095-20130614/7971_1 /TAXON_ID=96789 ORGANISM="Chromulina nebulosa, Strain UTEXLB2642" /NCGR_SAMPLE_ID=MMETSP1095 /ASSEMBLY_ACC=CAM_ASM_000446 /LENGTH=293 /DNA_ID=CAMNT_0042123139 /DNA_START=629 /DNA_END=1510 /DNA_ORIENTATION=-